MRVSKSEREEAIQRLRDWITPGQTVYTVLDSVSRSGMSRHIRCVLIDGTGAMTHPNYAVGRALGLRHAKRNGYEQDALVVQGCGMDMGFHVVYNLSATLFPDGFGCIGEGCPSNDHGNGDRDYTPHMDEAGRTGGTTGEPCSCHREHWHRDGGYALRHRWI